MTTVSTLTSEHAPDDFERVAYYNGITGDDKQPHLLYRSDYRTTPFLKPTGRFAHLSVKTLRGVHDTALNPVWDAVGPEICALLLKRGIDWSSINPARFFTRGEPGSLGPVVVWIAVRPGSTSPDTAHVVSKDILAFLCAHGVEDAVVEWREAVLQRLAGPPLLRPTSSFNATHHVRRFLTPLLGVPLGADQREGTLTLWFHESEDPGSKVFGVSSRHVLRGESDTLYESDEAAESNAVRVCSIRQFQRGLADIVSSITGAAIRADVDARELDRLVVKEDQDDETEDAIETTRNSLAAEKKNVKALEAFHAAVLRDWTDETRQRTIGHVTYAPPITVDDEGDERFTSDWAVFEADSEKIRHAFEGNVVDLGSKYDLWKLTCMFYWRDGRSEYKLPLQHTVRMEGCSTERDLASPTVTDTEDQHCIIVGKDGATTGLTVGRYAGLMSYVRRDDGAVSRELAVYNAGYEDRLHQYRNNIEPFSAAGDSGALVWHTVGARAQIFGQLHSAENIGGSTSCHVSYCTPGWHLVDRIKKKFPHAEFYRRTWAS